MKKFIPWIVLTIFLAILFHVVGIWYVPIYMTEQTVQGIFKRRGTPLINQIRYGDLRLAGTDTVARDNPDTLTSFAVYDVSEVPLRLSCTIPDNDNYWSLSLFAWNTDNFFIVSDRMAKSKEFELVIVNSGSTYQKKGDEELVISPTKKGILIVRMIVTDRDDLEEISRLSKVQKETHIIE